MSLGKRIRTRIGELGFSQSAVARDAGMPQSTLNTLIHSDARWSPHLVRLARALRTTPAYLTGETDDPNADAPPAPEYSHEDRELLELFHQLAPDARAALRHVVRSMTGQMESPPTVHAGRSSFHAEGHDPPRQLAAA